MKNGDYIATPALTFMADNKSSGKELIFTLLSILAGTAILIAAGTEFIFVSVIAGFLILAGFVGLVGQMKKSNAQGKQTFALKITPSHLVVNPPVIDQKSQVMIPLDHISDVGVAQPSPGVVYLWLKLKPENRLKQEQVNLQILSVNVKYSDLSDFLSELPDKPEQERAALIKSQKSADFRLPE